MNYIHQLSNGFSHIGLKDLWIILAILVMDAALSADNSVAINALALNVNEKLRKSVIWAGLGLAAVLRVVALAFAAFIIANPWVQVIGGAYLCYLFYGHFFSASDDDEDGVKAKSSNFWVVLAGIGFLDLSLSTDNVIAVVAMSQNFAIIFCGVIASIFILAIASQVVLVIMEKVPSLESAAYVILLFLALIMFAGHTAETVVWIGQKCHFAAITNASEAILKYKYNVGDMLEILGVGIIITCAVVWDKIILPLKQPKQAIDNGLNS